MILSLIIRKPRQDKTAFGKCVKKKIYHKIWFDKSINSLGYHWEIKIWQVQCGAVVIWYSMIEDLHQLIIAITRGLTYSYDVELIYSADQFHFFFIHDIMEILWQALNICVWQLSSGCLIYLSVYWICNNFETIQVPLSLFCLKRDQF